MKLVRGVRLLALGAMVALTACGNDSAGLDDDEAIVGTWDVVSIDGNNLPWTENFTDPGFGTCSFTVSRMELTFRSNERYSGQIAGRSGCNGDFEDFDDIGEGDYRVSGDRLFLTSDGDPNGEEGELRFTFSGNDRLTLRESVEGETTVYVLARR